MPDEEREDPRMSRFMEKFGRTVRAEGGAEPLFAPGRDLSWLDDDRQDAPESAEAVSADTAGSAASGETLRPRFRWPRTLLATAATVVLLAGVGWWALGGRASPPGLSAMRLSRTQGVLRGDEAPVFHSGDRIWLHVDAAAPGQAFIALLDEHDQLVAVSDEPIALREGANVIGPFALDDQVGTASMLIVAGSAARTRSWFTGAMQRARRAAAGASDHASRLAAINASLRAEKGVAVSAVTYQHAP
jgi:hypothetical protein